MSRVWIAISLKLQTDASQKKIYLYYALLNFLIFKSTSVFRAFILFWIVHQLQLGIPICNMYLGISFLNLFEDNIYSSAFEIAATKSIEADLLSFFL